MLVYEVNRVRCIWTIIWVSWSMLFWDFMGAGIWENKLEESESNVAQIKNLEFLFNLLDLGE